MQTPPPDLTDDDKAIIAELLHETIERSRRLLVAEGAGDEERFSTSSTGRPWVGEAAGASQAWDGGAEKAGWPG